MQRETQWEDVIDLFPQDVTGGQIESTASDLEGMNYSPMLLIKTPHFLRMTQNDLKHEIDRVLQLSPERMKEQGFGEAATYDKLKAKHIQLLLYHFDLLCRLRNNDPTAWDTVNELYEDD